MDLILTHSNTDFDGLAAQLAAARLFVGAVPLLSSQLNGNVRAFLALAEEELPFVRVANLPTEPITRLILVDTDQPQHLPFLPSPLPQTLIIDHHPLNRPLAEHEQQITGEAGATTTLLIERLIEVGVALQPIEATLLLLGIYEDTGSLALPGTRRADLVCAAWLLGQGARLEAVSEFLSRSLSAAQEQIYRDLEDTVRIEQVAGWPVLLASAHVDGPVPELSPLAHRLRDRYAPAVTAVAIGTADAGTQLIIRANSEALHAGELAARFDGGGHAAAAAAFVRGRTPDQLLPELNAAIRLAIHPSLTAADLMSRRVRTVPLGSTIAQAAALQSRNGHTALPVVDSEELVHGLIARTDLDRALRHGLGDAPLARYMWRGPQMVAPETPLAALRQALLNDDGRITGRLLVVDAQRHLLGIVTRADLLRAWEGSAIRDTDGQADTASALERFLPAPTQALLKRAAALAERRGTALYIVGGAVRDMLLKRVPGDLDLVVEEDALGLAQALASELGGHVHNHAQFGTATLELDLPIEQIGNPKNVHTLHSLDFVTARSEFYERPAALPEVEVAALRHDLHRRDFTINTLAICLNPSRYGRLYDFYGGRRDLERRLVRVLHNLSFIDDPTRMLRAARLAARLGCTIEPRTRALIADALEHHVLERTTPQRVLTELMLALAEAEPEGVLKLLDDLGVLQAIHPALQWDRLMASWFAQARRLALPADTSAVLDLALLVWPLSNDQRIAFAAHYHLSSRLTGMLRDLSTLRSYLDELSAPALADSLIDQRLHGLDDAALYAAQIAAPEPAASYIKRYLAELRDIRLELNGHDLRALGLTPGPTFRTLFEGLRAARLDGLAITREQQIAWVKQTAGL